MSDDIRRRTRRTAAAGRPRPPRVPRPDQPALGDPVRLGRRGLIEAFRARVRARLVLLPPHDPQFRRNRERVNRDAERENFLLEWDLGFPDDN